MSSGLMGHETTLLLTHLHLLPKPLPLLLPTASLCGSSTLFLCKFYNNFTKRIAVTENLLTPTLNIVDVLYLYDFIDWTKLLRQEVQII